MYGSKGQDLSAISFVKSLDWAEDWPLWPGELDDGCFAVRPLKIKRCVLGRNYPAASMRWWPTPKITCLSEILKITFPGSFDEVIGNVFRAF